jgi:methyl-accepting chemotaxis protein
MQVTGHGHAGAEGLGASVQGEFAALRADLARVRAISADAVAKMGSGFRDLREQSRQQHELVQSLVTLLDGAGAGHGRRAGLQSFTTQTGALLRDLLENILASSARSVETAEQMGGLTASLDDVVKLTGGAKRLADHTRLLALNATMEAARAGAAGTGFSVVAREVKNLSAESHGFSDQISETVTQARSHLTRSLASTQGLAAKDQRLVEASRARMGALDAEIADLNAQVSEHLARAAAVAKTIDQGVGLSLTALQFEDLLSQVTDQIDRRLNALEPLAAGLARSLDDVANDPSPGGVAAALGGLRGLSDAVGAGARRTVEQTSMDAGDVTLF